MAFGGIGAQHQYLVDSRAWAHIGSIGLEAISVAVTLEGVTMTNETVEGAIARLREQHDLPSFSAAAFEPMTRKLFSEAGVKAGMHVLDVFSGAGDVAFLARELVGSQGRVTGVDQSPESVAYANDRAAYRGLTNVEFVEAQLEDLPFRSFDAIVGRVVLMYRRDPIGDLRALVRSLRPGGLVVFQELDLLAGKTVPPAPIVNQVRGWILEAFDRAGIELEMGPRLYAAFRAAGLNAPQMRVDGFIGGAESICPALVAKVARMLEQQLRALGVARAEDVEIDTLEERMRADLSRTGGVMSTPLLIGAWARLPS